MAAVHECWEEDALVYSKREGVDLWRRLGDFVRDRARRIVGNEGRVVEVMEVVGVKVVVYYSSASGRHTIPF